MWLEGLKYHGIQVLYLAVSSRVGGRGPVDPNTVVVVELEEFLLGE